MKQPEACDAGSRPHIGETSRPSTKVEVIEPVGVPHERFNTTLLLRVLVKCVQFHGIVTVRILFLRITRERSELTEIPPKSVGLTRVL